MSLRYRRSVRLGKGVKVNLTKTGVGLTVGGKGAHYTVHSSGRRTASVGLPGTGLYYQTTTKSKQSKSSARPTHIERHDIPVTPQIPSGHTVGSTDNAVGVTSESYTKLRDQLNLLFSQRQELEAALKEAKSKQAGLAFAVFMSYMWIFGFFYKGIKEKRDQQNVVVTDIEKQLEDKVLHLTTGKNSQVTKDWSACVATFQKLMASQRIWDVTYTQVIDRVQTRSYASSVINRTLIKSNAAPLDFIRSDVEYLVLPNANGPDIYVFPTFLLLFKSYQEFGIFDLKQVKFTMTLTQFVEREGVPSDTEVIKYTWFKTNKDGSRDKRFNGNYQIPVVKYGDLVIESITDDGLHEYYMFSDFKAFLEFGQAYVAHAQVLSMLKSKAQ